MRPILLAAVLLLVPLSGCLSAGDERDGEGTPPPDLPEKRFEALPAEEVWVPSSVDGKRINNAVYRPDTDEPVGVFINFSPYWGDDALVEGDPFSKYMIEEYVPRGFAVVLSAVRGTGHSEGCFQIAGDLELQDTYDVVDFFASQEWSNGRVAAGGKSYDSTTQNGMVAKVPHDALEGIFHVSGITDMYRYNYRNGVPYTQGPIFNTYYYGQTWHEYGLPLPLGGGSPSGAGRLDEDPESLARLLDDVACAEMPLIQAHGVASGVAGTKTDYWIERDWNRYIADSAWDGNVFFVHGLQDWNVKPDHILPWLDLLPPHIDRLVWLHQDTYGMGHVYPMRDDWNQTMLRWLDHTLNAPNGFFDGPDYHVADSEGLWHTMEVWPTDERQVSEGDASGITLSGPLRLTGEAILNVTVTATSPDPIFTAVLRGPGGSWVNEAVMRVAYRNGLEAPEAVQPGQTYTLSVPFYPMDFVLGDGDEATIRFQVQPREALVTDAQLLGATVMGAVTLDAATASLEPDAIQPEAIECFAC